MQVEAQRGRRLHAVEVDHLAAGERGEVAALAQFLHQLAQHRMARALVHVVHQHLLRQLAQPAAQAEVAAVGAALQQAAGLQLLQHAVQRGLGQARFFRQRRQRSEPFLPGDHLQQAEQAQRRAVCLGNGTDGLDELHGAHHTQTTEIGTRRTEN